MCPTAFDFGRPSGLVFTEHGRRVLEEILPHVTLATLTGAEVFYTPPDTYAWLMGALLRNEQVELMAVTNATLLDHERTQEIVDRYRGLTLSLESLDPELYRSIRVGAELESVLENLDRLHELKRAAGKGMHDPPLLHLNCVIFRDALDGLPELVRLAARLEIRIVAFTRFLLFDRRQRGTHADQSFPVTTADRARWRELFESMVDLGRCHGVTVVDRTATLVPRSEDHLPWHTSRVGGTETCPDPWSTLFVRTDGSTAFCTASELNLGNVNTDSFDESGSGSGLATRARSSSGGDCRAVSRSAPGGWSRSRVILARSLCNAGCGFGGERRSGMVSSAPAKRPDALARRMPRGFE